jgi:hypothetical protein
MTVKELIEILKTLDDQDRKIVVRDTAAGHLDIDDDIEDVYGFYYILHPSPSKRSKGKKHHIK